MTKDELKELKRMASDAAITVKAASLTAAAAARFLDELEAFPADMVSYIKPAARLAKTKAVTSKNASKRASRMMKALLSEFEKGD